MHNKETYMITDATSAIKKEGLTGPLEKRSEKKLRSIFYKKIGHKKPIYMNKHLNDLKNMYQAVQLIILKYVAQWTGYVPFETGNTTFNKKVNDISEAEQAQEINTKGYTQQKRTNKRTMANLGVALAGKVRAFAAASGNEGLFGEMSIKFAKLFYSKANLSLAFAKMILDAVNALTPAQRTAYNILDADITAYEESISNFESHISLPRELIAIRKFKTLELKTLCKETSKFLTDELDNLMENFTGTDFYSEYKNARIIVNQVRHTAIDVNVTRPGGEDLKKVKVTMTGKNLQNEVIATFEDFTDKDGNMIRRELNPELDWDVKFELPDYTSVEYKDLDLEKGEHLKLEVVMKPIVP